ncbi:MAG: LysM peptidoglycan-binding domain-containing protein [Planctomycetota bacterium]
MKNIEKGLVLGILAIIVIILIIASQKAGSLEKTLAEAPKDPSAATLAEKSAAELLGSLKNGLVPGESESPGGDSSPAGLHEGGIPDGHAAGGRAGTPPAADVSQLAQNPKGHEETADRQSPADTVYANPAPGVPDLDTSSSSAVPSPVSPQRAGAREYRVRLHDTFEKIAEEQLGDRSRVDEIVKLNEDVDPRRLLPDQVVWLPAQTAGTHRGSSGLWDDQVLASNTRGAIDAAAGGIDVPRTDQRGSPDVPVAAAPRIYVVKKGDTLISIARAIYSTPNWKKIWEANRDRLDSPDSLRPGTQLVLP